MMMWLPTVDGTVVGQILGFKYLSGSRKSYTFNYVPITDPTENARKIGVLYTLYKITEDNKLENLKASNLNYLDIKSFPLKWNFL